MGWKMVRDHHQKVLSDQISGKWRTAPDPVSSLIKKLGEEYSELVEKRDPEELYDFEDVLRELIDVLDKGMAARRAHLRKQYTLGMFGDHVEWHPNPDLKA